ncbi:hypothetical protein LDENG_00103840, partial [Lucifuga dentata]
NYSSAFNTIVPSELIIKLQDLGLSSTLCTWTLNFLSDRPQKVRLGDITSFTLTFSDDTTIIGLITGNNETAYRGGENPNIMVSGQQPPS